MSGEELPPSHRAYAGHFAALVRDRADRIEATP